MNSCYHRLCEDGKVASYESFCEVHGGDAGSSCLLQGSKKVSVQLDCSRSTNAVASRESSVHVLEVMSNSIIVSLHNWESVVHNLDYGTSRLYHCKLTQLGKRCT